MVDFKVVVNDPDSGKSYNVPVSGQHASVLVRKRIGDEVDGMFVGLPGYTLQLTGGSDKDGFAMRPEIPGASRKKLLVTRSIGFQPKEYPGQRRKLTFRGSEVGPDIVQINAKIITRGPKDIESLLEDAE